MQKLNLMERGGQFTYFNTNQYTKARQNNNIYTRARATVATFAWSDMHENCSNFGGVRLQQLGTALAYLKVPY